MSEFGQNVNSPVLYFQFHRGLQVFRNFFVPWQRDIGFLLTRYFHKNPPNLICNHFSCYAIVFVSGAFAFVFVDLTNTFLVDFFDFLSIFSICIRKNQFKIGSFSWKEKRQQKLHTKSEKFPFSLSTKFFMHFR